MRLSISVRPASVNARAPVRRRKFNIRQAPCASLSPRSPSPSPLAPVGRGRARFPRACLCVTETARFGLPPGAFPSPQSVSLVPHAVLHSSSENTLVAALDSRVGCTITETATVECATATRTRRSSSCLWTEGGGQHILRESWWVLFGCGTLGGKVWSVGVLDFVDC